MKRYSRESIYKPNDEVVDNALKNLEAEALRQIIQ